MNIMIHLLQTIFFAKLLDLSINEIIWAILFGVLIDLDHLVKIPLYLKQNGFKVVRYWNWRTPIQEPVSYLWVIPLSFYFHSWNPILFFTAHLVLDYIKGYQKKPFFPFIDFRIPERKRKRTKLVERAIEVMSLCTLLFLN